MSKKGFVLAESIVVSVFVLGIFTYLAVNVIPLVTQYDRAINYDNPQEVYAANILAEELSSRYLLKNNDETDKRVYSTIDLQMLHEAENDNKIFLSIYLKF